MNPVADLLTLTRVPATVARDLQLIAEAVRSVPAIEKMLASVLVALGPLMSDVEDLRDIVEPQQKRVAPST